MPCDENSHPTEERKGMNVMKNLKKWIAMLCALMLLVGGAAHAENEDYDKLDNDTGYFSPAFMQTYFHATETITALDIDVKLENDTLSCYAYMDDYSLYSFRGMEVHTPVWVCKLTRPPEGWQERVDSLTDEEKEQLNNVVTDIMAHNTRPYGFSAFSGRLGVLDGLGLRWNEVVMDVSDIKKQDGVTPREIARSELSDAYYDCLVLDEDGEFGRLYRFDRATGEYRVYETEGLVSFCPYKDGDYLIQCVREDGSYEISRLNPETGEITALDYDLSLFSHTGRRACGLSYDRWGEGKEPIVVMDDGGLIYRLYPGEKALLCGDYSSFTVDEHTSTSMAGSTNYFVFSEDLTWCMLHEYGHESEPTA